MSLPPVATTRSRGPTPGTARLPGSGWRDTNTIAGAAVGLPRRSGPSAPPGFRPGKSQGPECAPRPTNPVPGTVPVPPNPAPLNATGALAPANAAAMLASACAGAVGAPQHAPHSQTARPRPTVIAR